MARLSQDAVNTWQNPAVLEHEILDQSARRQLLTKNKEQRAHLVLKRPADV